GRFKEIDCAFALERGVPQSRALEDAIARIRAEAESAVRDGFSHLILTDERIAPDRAPIPMILAAGAVHSHLVRRGLRSEVSINVRAADCLDTHYAALLIGVGATTVNAYLAQECIADRHARGLFGAAGVEASIERYKRAVNDGLLKIMSKMGISVISSYRGAYNFEAVGLSRTLVAEFFPGMTSRISGIGLAGIQLKTLDMHRRGFAEDVIALPMGGFYRYRRGGELHAFEGTLIHTLQTAVGTDSYGAYRRYSEGLRKLPPIHLRDLLDFKPKRPPVSVDEVESITEIRKRLVAPGISLGALGPEAHETLSIAMNRIGAKSDSGEG